MPKFFPALVLTLISTSPLLPASTTVVVTLSSVGDRVRAQNPELAAARLQIVEATHRVSQAGRLKNPEISSSLERNPQAREARLDLGLSQRFPITDRLRLEKGLSRIELQAAEAEVREIERALIGQARAVIVTILAAQQRRKLLQEQSRITQDFADFLSATASKGEGSALDAGQAKLEAAGLSIEIRQLDAGLVSSLGDLKTLLGIAAVESLLVSGSLPEPTLPNTPASVAQRPAYQAAELGTAAAKQSVALERAKRFDDVEGGLFTGIARTEDVPQGFQNEAIVGLRFSMALPFWNTNAGAIHEAQAKQQRLELEAAALNRSIQLEVQAARSEMEEWTKLITEITDHLLPLAAEQTELAETSYREAQGGIQIVLRSREKRLQLTAAKLDALRSFHLARVRLLTALGTP